eukprot:Skav204191  [mRNA]  locus=scaffold3772:49941:59595:+ [translate_table: standard]
MIRVSTVYPLDCHASQLAIGFSSISSILADALFERLLVFLAPELSDVEEFLPSFSRLTNVMLQFLQVLSISSLLCLCGLEPFSKLRLLLLRSLKHRLLHHRIHCARANRFASHLCATHWANELLRLKPAIDAGPAKAMGALDGRRMDQPVLANATRQFAAQF